MQIKAVYKMSMASLMIIEKKAQIISNEISNKTKQGCALIPLLLNIVPEVLASL